MPKTNRIEYIGGSDAAAVLGLSRWSTPLMVWAEKTGQVEPKDKSDLLYIKLGNRLEDVVCDLFCEETGKQVERVEETIFHPTHRFLGANIDRRVVGEDAILEIKTTSGWKAKEWKDEEVPREYILQCLHYLGITGTAKCYIAVLILGNQDFKWKVIERNDKLIKEITAKEVEFWEQYVVPKAMPVSITNKDSDILYQLFPVGDDSQINLPDEADAIVGNIEKLTQELKEREDAIEKLKNDLKSMLKESTYGKSGKYIVTWKNQTRTSLDVVRMKKTAPDVYKRWSIDIPSRVLRYQKLQEDANGDPRIGR